MSKFSLIPLSMFAILGLSACGSGKKTQPSSSSSPSPSAPAPENATFTTEGPVEFREGVEPYATDFNCERALWGIDKQLGGEPFAAMGGFSPPAKSDEGSTTVPKRLQGSRFRYVLDPQGYYQFTLPENATKLKVTAAGHAGVLYYKPGVPGQADAFGLAEGENDADFTPVTAIAINDEGARILSLWSSMGLLFSIKLKLDDAAQKATVDPTALQTALKICQSVQLYTYEGGSTATFGLKNQVENLRSKSLPGVP